MYNYPFYHYCSTIVTRMNTYIIITRQFVCNCLVWLVIVTLYTCRFMILYDIEIRSFS